VTCRAFRLPSLFRPWTALNGLADKISLVDPLILLAVIFDNKAPIGAIRFWAKKISGSIKPALEKMASDPRQELSQDLRKGLQDEVDNLF